MSLYTQCAAVAGHVDELGAALATWERRRGPGTATERRAASTAISAIDAAVAELFGLRAALVGQVRAADDLTP